MKFIYLFVLRFKLADLFKKAEMLADRGVESGDQQYVQLLADANVLIHDFTAKYPIDVELEFPAIKDLMKLTVVPEPRDIKHVAIATMFGIFLGATFIGAFGAMVGASYHAFSHVFHLMGL